ncbi:MAG: helix-turn-helix domain-containing protein [Aeromicrobium sp.]|uniref:helix-turn-helix domain-containing protein n=1 Tax=Aeromicrobium sp. TaxID=1871063 RepID=UPI0039E64A9D
MLVNAPPSLPGAHKHEPDDLDEPLVLWVGAGVAQVRLGGSDHRRIEAGSAIWLPPGTEHDVWTEPGSLAMPLWGFDAPPGTDPERVHAFDMPVGSSSALIEHYASQGFQGHPWRSTSPAPTEPRPLSAVVAAPPMPRGGPARRVAQEVRDYPALDHTLHDWAVWAACSPNTLRRAFVAQTGLTFAEWRLASRLAHAAGLLASGATVGEAGAAVGFASRWGFAGAFRSHYGLTPRDFAAQAATRSEGVDPAPPVQPTCEPLDENVMLWVRGGELRARFADTAWVGRADDVVWLPAGAVVERAPDAALPLSVLCTECVRLERPRRVRFARGWHDWLVWASVSTNTLLRPEEHRGRHPRLARPLHSHVIDAFEAQSAVERARAVPLPSDPAARAVAEAFLRSPDADDRRRSRETPAEVRQAFRRDTGLSFADWRLAARMRAARKLLHDGVPSGSVAPRVGYTMTSNFSRAFTRFHGVGPREFQHLEGPEDHLLLG